MAWAISWNYCKLNHARICLLFLRFIFSLCLLMLLIFLCDFCFYLQKTFFPLVVTVSEMKMKQKENTKSFCFIFIIVTWDITEISQIFDNISRKLLQHSPKSSWTSPINFLNIYMSRNLFKHSLESSRKFPRIFLNISQVPCIHRILFPWSCTPGFITSLNTTYYSYPFTVQKFLFPSFLCFPWYILKARVFRKNAIQLRIYLL